MNRKFNFHFGYLLLAFMGISLLHSYWVQQAQVSVIPYSEYEKLVKENRIEEVNVSQTQINGTIRDPSPSERKQFVTTRVDPDLTKELAGKDVTVFGQSDGNFFYDLLAWTLPAVIFFSIWLLLLRRFSAKGGLGGEFMALGKNKAKVYIENDTRVTFQDVAGIEEAEVELHEIVDFLKNPTEYSRLGGRMPKGVLLIGPPGTGKTLLAKAVAGEAGVPFFSISGSEFVEMFVGIGAARVRDLFEQARLKAPAIVFIDELDALGRSRGAGPLGGHDEKEQTLNQLLVELDGFDSQTGLILLAATNRPEILDPALLRAGRFDRQILVDRPDRKGRIAILKVHMKRLPALDATVDPEKIAALTPGFTGADLANLTNEAALVATRRKAESVTIHDFTEAIERIVAGLEKKNRVLSDREREIVAYHEMGHALVAAALSTNDKIHKVSVIPRGIGALGYTIQRPTEDRFLMTKEELEKRIAVLLGGRASELLVFKHLSTGAADDLAKATDIAWSMVTRYGMMQELGHMTYDRDSPNLLGVLQETQRRYGHDTAQQIDYAVKSVLDECFHEAVRILIAARDILEESARLLLQKETLNEGDLEGFFARVPNALPSFHKELSTPLL